MFELLAERLLAMLLGSPVAPKEQVQVLSPEFLHKIKNLQQVLHYYGENPDVDSQSGIYADIDNYLTTEDIGLLLSWILDQNKLVGREIKHLRLIEDEFELPRLQRYLNGIGDLPIGSSIPLILKMKKGVPAHYGPSYGVHVVPIYIRRCEDNCLRAFIYDSASGLLVENRDGFDKTISVLSSYMEQYDPHFEIIKTAGITQADAVNCPVYALHATQYYLEHGDTLFETILPHTIKSNLNKVIDKDNPHILHLKADGLPPRLLELTNRRTLQRVQDAYQHPWMPKKVTLSRLYSSQDDLLVLSHRKPVKQNQTVLSRLKSSSVKRSNSKGEIYHDNLRPKDTMLRLRKRIGTLLLQIGAFDEHSEKIDVQKLELLINRMPVIR